MTYPVAFTVNGRAAQVEANPMAEWLFGSVGLVPGILFDSAITLVAVAFLLTTPWVPQLAKRSF